MVDTSRTAGYFGRCLSLLPSFCTSLCSNRLSIAFFALSGLDILDQLKKVKCIGDTVRWIYSFQIIPDCERTESELGHCGFRGSLHATDTFLIKENASGVKGVPSKSQLDTGHIAMTYTALCSLLILGDDLSGIDREAVIAGIKALQLEDGNFCATLGGSESDMRFVYCAAAVCYILNDWSGLDKNLATKFIISSMSYDGGVGEKPNHECHGGLTYCGVAALHLMGTLETLNKKVVSRLTKWCLTRQVSGFQGRPNKPADTCYSFWIGATLKILNAYDFVDTTANRAFTMSTREEYTGGFAKWPDSVPDPLHSYLGLAGLSLAGEEGLQPIHPSLNISMRAYEHLKGLQERWR